MGKQKSIEWRNRISGEGEKKASEFKVNPKNWRTHPQNQRDALVGALNEVGWVQRVIVNRRTGYLLDGHERIEEALKNGDAVVPYVEVDLDEDEEAYVLATLDPIGAMASADSEKLGALLQEVKSGEAGIQAMMETIAAKAGLIKFDPMDEWQGMPEFENNDVFGNLGIKVHFQTIEDMEKFAELVGQTITTDTKYIWYPKQENLNLKRDYHAHES